MESKRFTSRDVLYKKQNDAHVKKHLLCFTKIKQCSLVEIHINSQGLRNLIQFIKVCKGIQIINSLSTQVVPLPQYGGREGGREEL